MKEKLLEIVQNNQTNKILPFKNIFKGEDIYVIASGKSLDFINPDFFSDKITIGVNHVYKKVKTTFLIRKDHKILDHVIKTNNNTIHIFSKGNTGQLNDLSKKIIEKSQNKNLFYFDHNRNERTKIVFPQPEEDKIIVSWSTITSAMHFASYIGAKNIILVGHDCGKIDGKSNFEGYHTTETLDQKNVHEYEEWLKNIEDQSLQVKKFLKERYGSEVYSLNPFINFGLEGHIYTR